MSHADRLHNLLSRLEGLTGPLHAAHAKLMQSVETHVPPTLTLHDDALLASCLEVTVLLLKMRQAEHAD